jgi:phosphopantothenoylcysteine synthetase/decarboxylase
LLVATGSVAAADVPFWVTWLRESYPAMRLQVVLTPTAGGFVSSAALTARLGEPVHLDRWDDGDGRALHVEWARWAEAVLVHPATLDYLSRFAHGAAGTPSLLAAQITTAPVVLAPALPPGGVESHAFRRVLELLAPRTNVAVAPTRAGVSLTTGEQYTGVPALLPDLLVLAEQRRRETMAAAEPVGPAIATLGRAL